jgi:hypothetical protein
VVAAAQAPTPAWTPDERSSGVAAAEPLIAGALGTLDLLGRAPLGRLRFARDAALPAGVLAGPLLAVVEAGTFAARVGGDEMTLGPGDTLEAAVGEAVTARATGPTGAAWLVLLGAPPDSWEFLAPPDAQPAPGLAFAPLFRQVHLAWRGAPARFWFDRVTLAPGAVTDLAAACAGRPASSHLVRVEAGVAGLTGTTTGEPALDPGDDAHVGGGGAWGVRNGGTEPAVPLVLRVEREQAA